MISERFIGKVAAPSLVPVQQIMMYDKTDEWRKRAIFWLLVRLLLGLIQIIGATAAVWLLLADGIGWLSCGAVVITLVFTLLHCLLFSRRSAKRRPTTTDQEHSKSWFAKT